MTGKVADEFGGRIRIRVCGLCFNEENILLLNHSGIYGHDFWAPPGGGVNFGETIEDTIKREFEEECKTKIRIGKFLFGCEFIRTPFHALELFYEVESLNPPRLGGDPELTDHQVISALQYMSEAEIKKLDGSHIHGIFNLVEKPRELKRLSGFFKLH
jgi:8-oxo-dGTP diphosphatase